MGKRHQEAKRLLVETPQARRERLLAECKHGEEGARDDPAICSACVAEAMDRR